jgi:acetyl-CoA carboxylase biotin carboxyl carrier protein
MSDSQKPPLTFEDVREILQLLENSAFDKLELEIRGFRLIVQRGSKAVAAWADALQAADVANAEPIAASGLLQGDEAPPAAVTGLMEIRAPMVGTFYRAPRPGAPPFVDVGAMVEPQTTIGIIEIMKLMNAVPAGVAGEVREVCVGDGDPVEYDQVLMRVSP